MLASVKVGIAVPQSQQYNVLQGAGLSRLQACGHVDNSSISDHAADRREAFGWPGAVHA